MAKKKHSRSRGMKLPIAPLLGLVGGMQTPIQKLMEGNYQQAIDWASMNYTGYLPSNQTWQADRMKGGLVPLVIGVLVHKFVGGAPLNLNRTLAAAGVPVFRL